MIWSYMVDVRTMAAFLSPVFDQSGLPSAGFSISECGCAAVMPPMCDAPPPSTPT